MSSGFRVKGLGFWGLGFTELGVAEGVSGRHHQNRQMACELLKILPNSSIFETRTFKISKAFFSTAIQKAVSRFNLHYLSYKGT